MLIFLDSILLSFNYKAFYRSEGSSIETRQSLSDMHFFLLIGLELDLLMHC